MKTNSSEKPITPRSEPVALLSRLSGVGVTGFINHPILQEEEIIIQESDNVTVDDKPGSFCPNQQHCEKQLKCQPGKCQNAHATVDLWFYLSSPA